MRTTQVERGSLPGLGKGSCMKTGASTRRLWLKVAHPVITGKPNSEDYSQLEPHSGLEMHLHCQDSGVWEPLVCRWNDHVRGRAQAVTLLGAPQGLDYSNGMVTF